MDKGGEEEREGEMNGESTMEPYTLTHVKQIASGNLLWLGTQTGTLITSKKSPWEGWEEEEPEGQGVGNSKKRNILGSWDNPGLRIWWHCTGKHGG